MRALPATVALLAVVAAAVGIVLWLSAGDSSAPVLDADKPPEMKAPPKRDGMDIEIAKGGVFAGIVIDAAGEPIEGANVMLVAFNAGDEDILAGKGREDGVFDPGDPSAIPVVGNYWIGGREAVTEADGRFTIPAHSKARVTHVLAYHRAYFLNVVRVPGPTDGIVVPLNTAGKVRGLVVDDVTGRPVPKSRVDIYLQHPTALAPEVGTGREGSLNRGRGGVTVGRSEIAMLGHFLAKELGERLWDIPYQGTEALRITTNAAGEFEIGPLGEGVQLEFVITHPDYKWFDFDTMGGTQRAQRTIVHAGQTVEREFRLRRGLEIAGEVVDHQGKPVAGVAMAFESITAYHSHWWDSIGKKRYTKTDKKGRFKMGGLALGDHNVRLTHESFGERYEHGIPAGTMDYVITVKRRGRVIGTVDGLAHRPVGGRVYVTLEPTGDDTGKQIRFSRRKFVIDKQNQFSIEHVKEGPYEIWVAADEMCSMPQAITVEAGTPVNVMFELGGGGQLEIEVVDQDQRVVDPAIAYLVRVDDRGENTMGRYVARQGLIETDNLLPGRYRLRIEAAGFVPHLTEAFDVLEGRPTNMGAVTLLAWAYLRVQSVLTDRRRPPETDTLTEYREGDGEWKPLRNLSGFDVPVRPGAVEVRAKTLDGLSFEQRYEAAGGEVTAVSIVLR